MCVLTCMNDDETKTFSVPRVRAFTFPQLVTLTLAKQTAKQDKNTNTANFMLNYYSLDGLVLTRHLKWNCFTINQFSSFYLDHLSLIYLVGNFVDKFRFESHWKLMRIHKNTCHTWKSSPGKQLICTLISLTFDWFRSVIHF